MEILDWITVLQPFIALFILIILMIIMIIMSILYFKIKLYLPVLVIFLFSLIIGFNSMTYEYIPFNPYFSIFFILFQSTFFIEISLREYNSRYKI